MNFLRLKSDALARFRAKHPQYWMDRLVEQVMKRVLPGEIVVPGKVLAVLRNEALGMELFVPGINIVTNSGDLYYAQKIVGTTLTKDFAGANSGLRLGSGSTAPAKTDTNVTTFVTGASIAVVATYPKVNDGDADNTGAGTDIVTWRYDFTTAQGNGTGYAEGAIADDKTTPTAVLTHFLFAAAFDKTSSDTLKVIVNHAPTGV